MEENVRRYVRGLLEAFLEGKQNLNWIKEVIKKSGVLEHEGMLQKIFSNLQCYENQQTYQEVLVLKEYKKESWL